MKTLYLDCGMGAAGDMLTAALIELLPDPDSFVDKLNSLGIPHVKYIKEESVKCGITGTHILVLVEGQEEAIGVTETHPFCSVDREDFVPVGELVEGERLLLFNGETKRVTQRLPRPGPECVYNLEVLGEHVYLVTQDGLLVHNLSCIKSGWTASRRPSYQASEIDASNYARAFFGKENVSDQVSFLNGIRNKYGKGSVRPDVVVDYLDLIFAVEVKNYNLSKYFGQMKRKVFGQMIARKQMISGNLFQYLVIDARGQNIPPSIMKKIQDFEQQLLNSNLGFGGITIIL